jgi:Putative Ig domain
MPRKLFHQMSSSENRVDCSQSVASVLLRLFANNLKHVLVIFLAVCAAFVSTSEATVTSAAVYPQNFLNFGLVTAGTTGAVPQTISIFNQGTTSVTVSSVTISISQFQLVSGATPVTIAAGSYANFVVSFTPTSAVAYSATMTFNMSGSPNLKETLVGTGGSTTAVSSVSVTSLNFTNQRLGTVSAPQNVKITNTGTTAFKVSGVSITNPFAQTGFNATAVKINPGSSLTLRITYDPFLVGTVYGTLMISYDVLPSSGVSLSGTAIAPSALGINTFTTLPSAVQSAAYQATLTAVGGTGALTWSLASGSTLPSGLSLSSAGLITGTVASSVAKGNYSFTAQVTDSNTPPVTKTAVLTLPVAVPTGADCNAISFNVANTSTPLVPLSDLGTNYYLNQYQGGLYANGVNTDDPVHDAYGQGLAAAIQPLDANGNPSPTGKYVLVTIGQSNTTGISQEFVSLINADPSKNPNLVVVDGATGSAGGAQLADPNSFYWTVTTNNYLPNGGVTANQVVAAWVNDVDAQGNPPKIASLQSELESMAQNMLVKFPNLKIAYFSSVNYTGYSNKVIVFGGYKEPYAYEAGFGVKLAIQDQLNGNANLNFDPSKGTVLAPWMAWGPYYWANGLLARSDGMVWTCPDLLNDGTHPSDPAGRLRASATLLNFLKSDATAAPWFVAPAHK